MIPILIVIAATCILGLGASLTFTWASGRSALWNIGFGVLLVVTAASVLAIAAALLTRRL
jgi:hypothetical protein